jgi:multicomponent Na+:H+ antiporter subunit E
MATRRTMAPFDTPPFPVFGRHLPRRLIGSLLARAVLLALTWLVLVGNTDGWRYGFVAVAAIAFLSLRLSPPSSFTPRLRHLPGFLVFFLLQSLSAGADVARRTVSPRLPLHPAILNLPLTLPAGPPTWLLMLVVSLLPGTLSTSLCEGTLELHCLDSNLQVRDAIHEVERLIAKLFGISATPGDDK